MSLLSDLQAARPEELGESPWAPFQKSMPVLVPGLTISKLEVFGDGRVGIRGKSPLRGTGMFYLMLVLAGAGTGRPDGTREVRLGIDRYRDQADLMIYDKPVKAWLDPQPGAVAAWLTGVLTTMDPYTR